MMATEADNIATSSTSPDHELNSNETLSEDVSSEQPVLNGTVEKDDSKQDTDNVESIANSAEVSISGGSDTENSKAETSKGHVDEKGHVRTTSTVKKTSFKPVSVNKTFLAAKGAAPAIPSKLGDKGPTGSTPIQTGPSLSSAARPRLVAKSGSGLRDSAPRTSASANGGKGGAAPDASAVWNKNRPAPPPEPKRFTDEELKQRYGIHLATRLQSDDPGKQANWADIDDDDDDWAPESIEWTDGTKITLPQADDVPIPSPEPTPASIVKEMKAAEAAKPKSPAPTQASASPTVKPSTFGSGRAGLVLKGATEKPTLVAKPPGPPTPVKSPWAPLPPMEKVPPLTVEISQQHQPPQQRFNQRDPHGFGGMPPPAKEIAADDFSRSWRDSGNTSRELYNSQSGRYEPVNDARRGSVRSGDARQHQPAVLQRPLNHDGPAEPSNAFQTHRASGHDGPAEPSAAFQTHRASGHDGSYSSRRRTSSNVSGGSGNFARRMSRGPHDMPPPHEMLNVRRESLAAVSDSPSSPRNFSPSGHYQSQRGHQNQPWQRASPVVSHPSPQSTHGQMVPPTSVPVENQDQPAPAVYEDPIEVQKKVMRQTRELAIKRRQEEEAREEAARKERIRIKLEAMGPAPEKKSKKEAPKEEKSVPTQIQTRDATTVVSNESKSPATEVSASDSVIDSKVKAEPKAVNEPPQVEDKPGEKNSLQDPQTNGFHPQTPANLSQDSRTTQSWQNNSVPPTDRFRTWAPPPTQQSSSRNVWGPPSSDRTLGNGTFNPELSRLPEMHSSSHPGPIGPPNATRGNSQFQQGRGRELYGSRPAPIGPPNRQDSDQVAANKAAAAKSGWGALPSKLKQDDAALAQQQEQEIARKRELRESGMAPEPVGPVIQEKWRHVALNDDGTRGQVQGTVTAVHDPSQSWKNQPEHPEDATTRGAFEEQDKTRPRQIDPIGNQAQYSDAWRPASHLNNASPPVRGSRFFPNNRDVRLEEQHDLFERPGSPSPPPPTMIGHPAYDGDISRPHVSLPRPPPIVKLPPPTVLAPIGPPKPISFAAAVQAPVVPITHHNAGPAAPQNYSTRSAHMYQDVRRQEPGGWQEKIDSLVGRKNSPPKSHALAVDSSSKHALELPNQQIGATVSLPLLEFAGSEGLEGAVESKPAAEECFEEQEMGSLPVIKVPHQAPASAWTLATPPKALPRKFVVSQTTSVEPLNFSKQVNNGWETITIKMGQGEPTTVSIPVAARQKSNPRRGGSRSSTRGSSSSNHRGGRGRDPSSGFPSPNIDNASTSSSPSRGGRGGRGGYSGGSSWGRHVANTPAVRT